MENSLLKISQALLDIGSDSETVLYSSPKGQLALRNAKLESAQRSLLERIDGFRSIEQLLAMSGDLIGVHAALGKLMASGCVIADAHPIVDGAAPAIENVERPHTRATISASASVAEKAHTELDNAKRLLVLEAKLVLGNAALKLRPRIEACRSIEEIYDLIVKFQQHLATTGKANPDVFLDRLTKGLASARKQPSGAMRSVS